MFLERCHDVQAVRLIKTLLVAGAALALPSRALSQNSASVAVASSYSARGIALSDHPVIQLRVDHDTDDGWYVGSFASPVTLVGSRTQAELIVYGGRARQLESGVSWDAGVSRTLFLRDRGYGYVELYAGLALDRASASVFLSPAYYGAGRSAYLDLNAFHPLGEKLRLTAHAGLLHAFADYGADAYDRVDLRLGLTLDLGRWNLQASLGTLLRAGGGELARAPPLSASASLRF
jgi:uncharacterized protein (TIGR02001 family)